MKTYDDYDGNSYGPPLRTPEQLKARRRMTLHRILRGNTINETLAAVAEYECVGCGSAKRPGQPCPACGVEIKACAKCGEAQPCGCVSCAAAVEAA